MSVRLGVVGCGNISEIYLKNLCTLDGLEVAAVSDMDVERAGRLVNSVFVERGKTRHADKTRPASGAWAI
jgi:predicted homoserine dehydrogenase-like protein